MEMKMRGMNKYSNYIMSQFKQSQQTIEQTIEQKTIQIQQTTSLLLHS